MAKLDSPFLYERSTIAHSAMLILCLVSSQSKRDQWKPLILGLANGIIGQQCADGSFKIYFEDFRDCSGALLYAGEAMLALMRAYEVLQDMTFLQSVEIAFRYYFQRFQKPVDPESYVFYANWITQACALLFQHSSEVDLRKRIKQFLVGLHKTILVQMNFYEIVEACPQKCSTVEVACALEGICDACSLISNDVDLLQLHNSFRHAIFVAVSFLLRVQKETVAVSTYSPRGVGGFGHGLHHATQRIDVTGHVSSGFMKVLKLNQPSDKWFDAVSIPATTVSSSQ